MNRSVEEINKIVDIVMTDDDVWDALNDRILAQDLERLKMKRAYETGKMEIAKKLLEEGFDVEKIVEITGIDEVEIIELKK